MSDATIVTSAIKAATKAVSDWWAQNNAHKSRMATYAQHQREFAASGGSGAFSNNFSAWWNAHLYTGIGGRPPTFRESEIASMDALRRMSATVEPIRIDIPPEIIIRIRGVGQGSIPISVRASRGRALDEATVG